MKEARGKITNVRGLHKHYSHLGLKMSEINSIDCNDYVANYLLNDSEEPRTIEYLTKLYNEYIRNEIINNKNTKILSRYIQNSTRRMDENYDKEKVFNKLNKLDVFFDAVGMEPSVEIFTELLTENKIVAFLIEDNIITGDFKLNHKTLSTIYESKALPILVEAFCRLYHSSLVDDLNNYLSQNSLNNCLLGIKEKSITPEEEIQLLKETKRRNVKARQKLIEENMQQVALIAYSYTGEGMDFVDLLQEGSIGLINAIKHFDEEKDSSFFSCVNYWVMNAIEEALSKTNKGKVTFAPSSKREEYHETRKILFEQLGKIPTDEEVAIYLDISLDEVKAIVNSEYEMFSLETLKRKEARRDYTAFPSEYDLTAEDAKANLSNIDIMRLLNSCLNNRERAVLIHRNGLNGNEPLSLEEVGKIFDISHERTRQVEAKALRKLIRSSKIDDYIWYMENPSEAQRALNAKKEKYQIILKTIYDYHPDKTKEEVDAVLSLMSEKSLGILRKKYGDDLSNPVVGERLTKSEYMHFHNVIRKHMIECLGKPPQAETPAWQKVKTINNN